MKTSTLIVCAIAGILLTALLVIWLTSKKRKTKRKMLINSFYKGANEKNFTE